MIRIKGGMLNELSALDSPFVSSQRTLPAMKYGKCMKLYAYTSYANTVCVCQLQTRHLKMVHSVIALTRYMNMVLSFAKDKLYLLRPDS